MSELPNSEFSEFRNTDLLPEEIDTVIYHKACTDGFASAVVIREWFLSHFPNRMPLFFPVHAGDSDAFKQLSLLDRNILVVDLSFDKETIDYIANKNKKILILDHHERSMVKLASSWTHKKNGKNRMIYRGDMSGCGLAWHFMFGKQNLFPPKYVSYIEDRDLWKHIHPQTKEYNAGIFSIPFNFETWHKEVCDDSNFNNLVSIGKIILKKNEQDIKIIAKQASKKILHINGKKYTVIYLSSYFHKSDLGNYLLQLPENKHDTDFVVIYSYNDRTNKTTMSLRSLYNKCDVSLIASFYNGGGHKQASGMVVKGITNIIPDKLTRIQKIKKFCCMSI